MPCKYRDVFRTKHRLQQLQLQAERQAEVVARAQIAVGDGADEVEVARAGLVVEGERAGQEAVLRVDVDGEALAQKGVDAHLRREAVIAARIARGLAHPELFAEHGVQIHAARKRFDREAALLYLQAPGDVVLLQREGCFGPLRVVLGQKADEHVGFPLVAPAVIPAGAERQEPHASGKLHLRVRGDEGLPAPAVVVHAPVVAGGADVGGGDVVAVGRHPHGVVTYYI